MNQCLQCKRPFGLMRRWGHWRFSVYPLRIWQDSFCCDGCESMYAAERSQATRVLAFLRFLGNS